MRFPSSEDFFCLKKNKKSIYIIKIYQQGVDSNRNAVSFGSVHTVIIFMSVSTEYFGSTWKPIH